MHTSPINDAAPLAGGAGVNDSNVAPNRTQVNPVPPAHHNAPPGTSDVAADCIASRVVTMRAAVLSMLRERGEHGATDQEMQDALGLPSNTQIPRRWELVKAGGVVASGQKRKTRSNCPATVWVLSEFARKAEGGAA